MAQIKGLEGFSKDIIAAVLNNGPSPLGGFDPQEWENVYIALINHEYLATASSILSEQTLPLYWHLTKRGYLLLEMLRGDVGK